MSASTILRPALQDSWMGTGQSYKQILEDAIALEHAACMTKIAVKTNDT